LAGLLFRFDVLVHILSPTLELMLGRVADFEFMGGAIGLDLLD
jgi:hypothetical protein